MNQEKIRAIALNISQLILDGEYKQAHELLGPEVRRSMTVDELKESYEQMVEYFAEEDGAAISLGEVVVDDAGEGEMDAYVPVLSNNSLDESEAFTIFFDTDYVIQEFDFGRV